MAQPDNTYGVSFRLGADTTGLREGFAEAERAQEEFARTTAETGQDLRTEYQRIADELNIVIERTTFLQRLLEDLGNFARFGIPAAGIGGLLVLASQLRTVASILDFLSNRRLSRIADEVFGSFITNFGDIEMQAEASRDAVNSMRDSLRNAFRDSDRGTRIFNRISSVLRRIAQISFDIAVNWADIGTIVGTVGNTIFNRFSTVFANVGSISAALGVAVRRLNDFARASTRALTSVRSHLSTILDIGTTLLLAFGTRGAGLATRLGSSLAGSFQAISGRITTSFLNGLRFLLSGFTSSTATAIGTTIGVGGAALGLGALASRLGDEIRPPLEELNEELQEAFQVPVPDQRELQILSAAVNMSIAEGASEGLSDGIIEAVDDPTIIQRIAQVGREAGQRFLDSFTGGPFADQQGFADAFEGAAGRFVIGVPGGTGIGTGTRGVITRIFSPQETADRVNLAVFGSTTPFQDASSLISDQLDVFFSLFDIFRLDFRTILPNFTADIISLSEAIGILASSTLEAVSQLTGLGEALDFAREFGNAVSDLVQIFRLPELRVGGDLQAQQLFGPPARITEALERLLENIRAEYARLRAYFEGFLQNQDEISGRERLTQQLFDPRDRLAQAEEDLAVRYARKREEEIARAERARIQALQAEFFPDGIAAVRASIRQAEDARGRFAGGTIDFEARERAARTERLVQEFFPQGVDALRSQIAQEGEDPRARFAQATPDFLARALEEQDDETEDAVKQYAERLTRSLQRNLTFSVRSSISRFLSGREAGDLRALGDNLLDGITRSINNSFADIIAQNLFDPIFESFTQQIFGGFAESLANLGRTIADLAINVFSGIFSGIGGGIASIFGFQSGGVVPGERGAPRLALVHGGEAVFTPGQLDALSRGGGFGSGQPINVTFNVTGDIRPQTLQILREYSGELTRTISNNIYETTGEFGGF